MAPMSRVHMFMAPATKKTTTKMYCEFRKRHNVIKTKKKSFDKGLATEHR